MVTSSQNVGSEQHFWRKGETNFMHNEWRIWMSCIILEERKYSNGKVFKKLLLKTAVVGFTWTVEQICGHLKSLRLAYCKVRRPHEWDECDNMSVFWYYGGTSFWSFPPKSFQGWFGASARLCNGSLFSHPLNTSQTGSKQVPCKHQLWVLVDWKGDPVLLGFVFFIRSPRQAGESLLLKAENTKGGGYCRLWRDARPVSEQTEEAIKGLQGPQRELGLSRLSKSIPRFDLLDSEQASESEYGCTELVHSSHRLPAFICGRMFKQQQIILVSFVSPNTLLAHKKSMLQWDTNIADVKMLASGMLTTS